MSLRFFFLNKICDFTIVCGTVRREHYAHGVGQQKLGLGWPQCCFALQRSINSRLIVKFLTYLTSQLLTPCLHVFKYLTGIKTIHFLCTSLSRCNKQQGMIYKNWVKNDYMIFDVRTLFSWRTRKSRELGENNTSTFTSL